MAVAADGTVYATESFANRSTGSGPARRRSTCGSRIRSLPAIDGVALLADGAVYVNTFFSGELFRIPVNADGSAGAIVPIETSMPLIRPDGLRTVGPQTLIQAEGQGRVTELTINGNRAEVRVLQGRTHRRHRRDPRRRHRARPRRARQSRRRAVSPAVTRGERADRKATGAVDDGRYQGVQT